VNLFISFRRLECIRVVFYLCGSLLLQFCSRVLLSVGVGGVWCVVVLRCGGVAGCVLSHSDFLFHTPVCVLCEKE
jgi:hypothetical protein